ncbi:Transcriptional regulator, SARP family protein [Streptomyces venezuelae]|uniref:hypothetical protein n=1 Tax=Streptomyces gardneri TaxID=66892 RepID=UPI0006BC594A|nr:hypothetical protein [Streptomyces gardneri]ALO12765.1 Transcriptional regulator, SARP family protein [Streptomyces venezuelae]QPK49480.1 hypothetical protein H4W23_36020 [Streptomyces gardneri]WRK41020.1 hypothetical protein U0M97_36245 [Streptomyces venezuelae]CUM36587.1 hypothetical protein BN2537_2139 [Streptomyces venezuelae]
MVAFAAAAGEFDHACRIAEALVDHLARRGHFHECRAALEHALACADMTVDRRMPASLRICLGIVDWLTGMANCNLGAIHSQRGLHERALDHYATALALASGSPVGGERHVHRLLSALVGDLGFERLELDGAGVLSE